MPIDDLKDVRPPVDLPPDYFLLFLFSAILLIGAAIFLLYWLKGKLPKKAPHVVVRPAWEIAQEELERLKNDQLAEKGQVEEYFVRLSAIIRHYLERRFSVSVPEMTTDEFLIHMKTMPVLDQAQKASLKEFLTLSDMVKFARYASTPQEIEESLTVARRLVKETIPVSTPTV